MHGERYPEGVLSVCIFACQHVSRFAWGCTYVGWSALGASGWRSHWNWRSTSLFAGGAGLLEYLPEFGSCFHAFLLTRGRHHTREEGEVARCVCVGGRGQEVRRNTSVCGCCIFVRRALVQRRAPGIDHPRVDACQRTRRRTMRVHTPVSLSRERRRHLPSGS